MNRPSLLTLTVAALTSCATSSAPGMEDAPTSDGPRIVQPGAPGEATEVVRAEDFDASAAPAYTPADVHFMQGMIPHHAQALDMAALVPERAGSEGIRQLARRIEISQKDEIALMQRWLEARDEATSMSMGMMPGMLTPTQMDELAGARGAEFDRLFLEYMIMHHQGAVRMVAELFGTPGAGQESEIFQFAAHVDADQQMEVRRMRAMLETMR